MLHRSHKHNTPPLPHLKNYRALLVSCIPPATPFVLLPATTFAQRVSARLLGRLWCWALHLRWGRGIFPFRKHLNSFGEFFLVQILLQRTQLIKNEFAIYEVYVVFA